MSGHPGGRTMSTRNDMEAEEMTTHHHTTTSTLAEQHRSELLDWANDRRRAREARRSGRSRRHHATRATELPGS